ncbi:hypothetical protein ACFL5A_02890 [Gemmatimonadota bacterium]
MIEFFPVGRRLAFDAKRGRLWVVCRKCERWNLTPVEERWEAVEMCERLFRDTRVRVSTENVGLAKRPEGLELVRIGQPMRPEFAAWRYGDQFGRRRKRALLYTVGGVLVLGGIEVAGAAIFGVGGMVSINLWDYWVNHRTVAKLRTDDGRVIKLRNPDLLGTRLRPADDGHGFQLKVPKDSVSRGLILKARGGKDKWFEGAEAVRLVGQIIPRMNRMGGKKDTVQTAVRKIEHFGHPDPFLADLAEMAGKLYRGRDGQFGYIDKMPDTTKLALEMALHEEQERRALEGELWRLERAWEEAEEIAAIADSLLLPTGTGDFIEKHRESNAAGE